MSYAIGKIVPKQLVIREEDYWIVAVSILSEIFIAFSIYASVLKYRIPMVLLAVASLWFTTAKVKKGYGPSHAKFHLAINLVIGTLLFLGIFALTN